MTHRALKFWSLSRCFVCKNHKWVLGHMETSNSDSNHIVLNAQNDRWGLKPMETSFSGANHAVLHAQNDKWGLGPIDKRHSGSKHAVLQSQINRRSLGPIETCNSDRKVAVLLAKTTDEGWDPWRLVIPVLKALFCIQKPQMRAGTHGD